MSTATPSRPAPSAGSRPQARTARPTSLATTIDPIRVLRRHMVGIIASGLIGAAIGVAAYLGLRQAYPLYTSQVLFEIRPALQKADEVVSYDASNDEMMFRIGKTETILLTSRDVLTAALRNSEVQQTDWAKGFRTSDGKFNSEDALDDLTEKISADPLRSSNLFMLRWSAHNARDVPTVLGSIAAAYLKSRGERDDKVLEKNQSAFQRQLDGTTDALNQLTREMTDLIRLAGFTTLEDAKSSAQAFKMQQLTEQLTDAITRQSIARTSLETINAQLQGSMEFNALDTMQAERDPAVDGQIQILQSQKAILRKYWETLDKENPQLKNQEILVKSMEAEIEKKVDEIRRRNLEARKREAQEDLEKYTNAAEKIDAEMEKNNSLLRDVAEKQSEYELMKTKREYLVAQRQANQELINEVQLMRIRQESSRVQKVQDAMTPREPSFPKPEVIIPLGSLLLLGLTVGIVFLRELMDQRVKSASDVAVLPGASVLGIIPDRDDDPTKTSAAELAVRKHPGSVLTESYRQASAALLPLMDRNGHQTLLLMGGLPGSGTTTVATNLAAAASAAGRRVLVVDANFRRPRLAEAMGVNGAGAGLADVLSGGASIDEAVVEADGVSVMPVGSPANRVFDRLNNGTFDSMLSQLRDRYDLVIFDAPPAVVSGDAMMLANRLDAAVLVVRAHQEHRGLVARMIHQLSEARCELLGVLLNRPRGVAGGYLKKNYAAMAEYSAKA